MRKCVKCGIEKASEEFEGKKKKCLLCIIREVNGMNERSLNKILGNSTLSEANKSLINNSIKSMSPLEEQMLAFAKQECQRKNSHLSGKK